MLNIGMAQKNYGQIFEFDVVSEINFDQLITNK